MGILSRVQDYFRRTDYSSVWPSEEIQRRAITYSTGNQLYNGDHEEVYKIGGRYTYCARERYVTNNMIRSLTDVVNNRIFSSGIIISPDDVAVEKDFEWKSFATLLSIWGDIVVNVRMFGGKVHLGLVDPAHFTYIGGQPATWDTMKVGKNDYIVYHIYGEGYIQNSVYSIKDKYINPNPLDVEDFGMLSHTETGCSLPLLVHGKINSLIGEYGTADWIPVFGAQGELNHRSTKLGSSLDMNADPTLIIPESMVNHNTGKVDLSEKIVIANDPSSVKINSVLPNSDFQASERNIESKKIDICNVFGVAPASLGDINGNTTTSGLAQQMREKRTIEKAEERKKQLVEIIGNIYTVVEELLDIEPVSISFGATPAENMESAVTSEVAAINAGLTSRESAMKRIYGITDEQVKEELAKMVTETQ